MEEDAEDLNLNNIKNLEDSEDTPTLVITENTKDPTSNVVDIDMAVNIVFYQREDWEEEVIWDVEDQENIQVDTSDVAEFINIKKFTVSEEKETSDVEKFVDMVNFMLDVANSWLAERDVLDLELSVSEDSEDITEELIHVEDWNIEDFLNVVDIDMARNIVVSLKEDTEEEVISDVESLEEDHINI